MTTYTATSTGNWHDAATWSGGVSPLTIIGPQDSVTINTAVIVTIQSGDNIISSGTISITGTLINNGSLTLCAGTLTVNSGGVLQNNQNSTFTNGAYVKNSGSITNYKGVLTTPATQLNYGIFSGTAVVNNGIIQPTI